MIRFGSEQRYRQRYLDLIVNPSVREVFIKRTRLITVIREFLIQKGIMRSKPRSFSPSMAVLQPGLS
jgi:lysyl-tRNA synthetase, class II